MDFVEFGDPVEDFSDLDSFEGSWAPARMFRPGIDTLPDGDYEFAVVDGELGRAQNGDRIFKLGLQVNGNVVEKTWWLKTQEGANALCADLCALGLDADRWGPKHNRPLSQELPKAPAKLAGVRFRGKITTRTSNGKTYHNLHIGGKVLGTASPMPSRPSSPDVAGEATAKPSADIPF